MRWFSAPARALARGEGDGCGRVGTKAAIVLDADALTSFQDNPKALHQLLREQCVLTPHEGEFERIFPGLLKRTSTRIEAARTAAATARCTVLLKGADTVVAIAGRAGPRQRPCAAWHWRPPVRAMFWPG